MKTMDMRFDQDMIRHLIGQEFKKYRADPFVYTDSVTQIVGLYIGDNVYKLTNEQQMVDYYGVTDDIAIFQITDSKDAEIVSAFKDVKQIDTPVNGVIETAKLINDHQEVFENGQKTYDVWLTRGIIFAVDGREIAFEKQSTPFSEEINISRGYDLVDRFSSEKDFESGWDEGIQAVASREIITIGL